jgi:hypothetical protein
VSHPEKDLDQILLESLPPPVILGVLAERHDVADSDPVQRHELEPLLADSDLRLRAPPSHCAKRRFFGESFTWQGFAACGIALKRL